MGQVPSENNGITLKVRRRGEGGRLNSLAVAKLAKPGMHADGGGLYLHIGKTGAALRAARSALNTASKPPR